MKTERFEMRAGEAFLNALDDWRRRQPDLPSRAEAVRRLVEAALADEKKRGGRGPKRRRTSTLTMSSGQVVTLGDTPKGHSRTK
jgi:metal-responsive CopG/Arc/MetJ family transcriptional regulator